MQIFETYACACVAYNTYCEKQCSCSFLLKTYAFSRELFCLIFEKVVINSNCNTRNTKRVLIKEKTPIC